MHGAMLIVDAVVGTGLQAAAAWAWRPRLRDWLATMDGAGRRGGFAEWMGRGFDVEEKNAADAFRAECGGDVCGAEAGACVRAPDGSERM